MTMTRHLIPPGLSMGSVDIAPEPTLMESGAGSHDQSGWGRVFHRLPVHELCSDPGLMQKPSSAPVEDMNAPSTVVSYHPADVGYSFPGGICPRCNGIATRAPRRLLDLFVSTFTQVHRYQCHSMGCGWEGTIRVKRYPLLISGKR
jgi:hypothetical protein